MIANYKETKQKPTTIKTHEKCLVDIWVRHLCNEMATLMMFTSKNIIIFTDHSTNTKKKKERKKT